MTAPLSSLRRGRIVRPQRIVLYGPEGVGKTTLASKFPNPLFLDTEGGSDHLDIVRLPEIRAWADVQKAISDLATQPHEFKTLVIDTIDWLEKLLAEDLCKRANKSSIEDFGYGKGYVQLAEEITVFLRSLEALRDRGMHVVLLAHACIKKFEQPDAAGSFDRYELKLSKQVSPLVKEWCDVLLFANYFTRVAESDSGKKRGVGGKERVIYTSHCAAWDAKNRHNLPEKLPFEYTAIAQVFEGVAPAAATPATPAPSPPTAPASAPVATPVPADDPDAKLAGLIGEREEKVNAFLVNRNEIAEGQNWRDAKPEYKARIAAAPQRFFKAVEGGAK
jgi:hypothetical protein